jgi:Ca-activated chloride channel family protein
MRPTAIVVTKDIHATINSMEDRMKNIAHRFYQRLSSTRVGLIAFAALALVTGVMIGFSGTPSTGPHSPPPPLDPVSLQSIGPGEIKLTGRLSQTKLVQGSNDAIYLSLDLEAPANTAPIAPKTATDMIVVLDHSGSMAEENRLPFARQAIIDLLNRLTAEDRFALVMFDSSAEIVSELTVVTPAERERLIQIVNTIQPGSGTNMSEGLFKAKDLALHSASPRNRKVLLLSDGEANEGITQPTELNRIARSISNNGLILSTIGLGLGFNETLMASLADHGMGSYAYLEHLGGLGTILAQNLSDLRKVYAPSSELELALALGIVLLDAGGYPWSHTAPGVVRVPTGQILSGVKRSLTLTFNAPTGDLGEFALGDVRLRYQLATGPAEARLSGDKLKLAVLPAERRSEVVASVEQAVVKESWLGNNLGRLKAAYRDAVRAGDKDKAKAALDNYSNETQKVEAALGAPIVDEKTKSELKRMDQELDDAFAGKPAEQALKQNRLSKKAHAEGLKAQRSK